LENKMVDEILKAWAIGIGTGAACGWLAWRLPMLRGPGPIVIRRSYTKTTYTDGRVAVFDPFICWHLEQFSNGWIGEIGTRGDYSIGFMHGYRVGDWSQYRTRFLEFGAWTVYAHLGRCAPHNPRTGKFYAL
jgi:hypothetical protein